MSSALLRCDAVQRSLALTALALALAVLVSHASVVLGDDTWDDVRYHTDVAPPRLAAATQIAQARIPAWWDGTSFGVPLLAEPSHGALAPTTWLAHTPRALDAVLVLHLWWAALGVAAWARRRGASELAGLGAGLVLATSGVFASAAIRGALPALAMVPWLGLAAAALCDATERAGRARAALGLGAALAAIALAGQLAVLGDAIVLAVALAGRRAAWRWLAAGLAAGLAIGCAQWLPAALQLPRELGAQVSALSLARLVELVAPGRFADDGAWFPSVFAGAGLFALARLGRREVGALVVIGALALVAGRGGGWPAWAGAPELHVGVAVAIVAAAAASGLDGALVGDGRAARALLVATGVTVLATLAAARAHPDASAGRDGAVAVIGLGLAAWVAWRPRGGWAAPVVLALVVGPSVSALPDVAPTTERAPVEAPSAWATAARLAAAGPAPIRAFRPVPFVLAGGPAVLDLADSTATLAGTWAARWGIAPAHGTDPARDPVEELVWMRSANDGGILLDRYGVTIAIVPSVMVSARKFNELAERSGESLCLFPTAPAAAVMHGWRWTVAPSDALALIFFPGGGTGIPRGTVILRGAGEPSANPAGPDPCAIVDWRDGDIALTCDAGPAAAYAAVSSSSSPGWRAAIDGTETPWLTADVLRRAVPLPPGAHAVHWTYRAPGFALGAALAAAGLLALGLLGWASRRP